MIGMILSWARQPISPEEALRFARAFGLGRATPANYFVGDGLVAAATGAGAGWQPARTPQGHAVLLAGHIDDRATLQRALGIASAEDAELYAAAYARWGDRCDRELAGEFATIVVAAEGQWVRLARSPLTAPPLHIWQRGERLVVASTPHAIFATGLVRQEIDEQKIADSLFLNYRESERSWFKGVARLPTGTRAVAVVSERRSDRYYDVHALPEVRLPGDEDYVRAAGALFEAGTRAALDGFSRPAVSLSGGFDSQAVAAHAVRARGELMAFTAVPESGWDGRTGARRFGDESAHVAALAAMYPGLSVEWVDAAGLSFSHYQRELFLLAGVAPRNGMNLHWIHEIRARAKANGADVLLTGQRGNATFSFDGTGALPSLLRRARFGALLRELRAIEDARSVPQRFLYDAALPHLPRPQWRLLRRLWRGEPEDPLTTWCPLNPAWAREMRVHERALEFGYDAYHRPQRSTRHRRAALLENAANEAGDLMQGLAILHGVPTRDPTAYRPLVEFCIGIPDDQYLRNGTKRWLAKRMLRGIVPNLVLDETRRGVQAADWHLRLGRERSALREELAALERDPAMATRLDLPMLKRALDEWPAETPVGNPTAQRLQLGLTRALTTARFIHHIEGQRAG